MGQGVCADYGVFCVLLDSCGDSKPLLVRKSVNGFLKCSLFLHHFTRFQIKGFEFVF